MFSLPEMSSQRYPTSTSIGNDWPSMARAQATPATARKSASDRLRVIRSLLQQLRREVRSMYGGMARRAVAVPRKRQVVERRRLGPERVGRAGARVAGKTELIDPRPGEHLRIVRSVRL